MFQLLQIIAITTIVIKITLRGHVRVLLLKTFRRYQRREGITDAALTDAIRRAERGLIDAALGGGLIKQRVARQGGGKSGGYRTIIACRQGERAVFLVGFAKSGLDNIADDELAQLKTLCAAALAQDDKTTAAALACGILWEIDYDDET